MSAEEKDTQTLITLARQLRETALRHSGALKAEVAELLEACDSASGTLPPEIGDTLVEKAESISNRLLSLQATMEQCSNNIQAAMGEIAEKLGRLEKEVQNFRTLYKTGMVISSEMDLDKLLEIAMDLVLEVTSGERGFVVLVEKDGTLDFKVARNIERADVDKPEFQVSRGIIEATISKGETTLIRDAQADEELTKRTSVVELGLKSILCTPLRYGEETIGVVYVENRKAASIFTEDDARLLGALAQQITRGIQNAQVHTTLAKTREKLLRELGVKYNFEEIVGNSPQILLILELVASVCDTDATVLIRGESGTGKELIARALHYNSSRRSKPFVTINCAAIPENLLESELFGHVRGAFTGAVDSRVGRFEAAHGGSIFLDEIGDMPLNLQMKILRVLERKEIERLGSNKTTIVDVRVIAATNKDLRKAISEGTFREDLFHRLNVIGIELPPLRERREDIMLLANHFVSRFCRQSGKRALAISPECQRVLESYSYPGNVRELENTLKRAVILCKGDTITPDELPEVMRESEMKSPVSARTNEELKKARAAAREEAAARVERAFLIATLREAGGVVSKAASASGMNRVQYHKLLAKHAINPKDFST